MVPVLQSDRLQLVAQPSSSLSGHGLGRSALLDAFDDVAAGTASSSAGERQGQGRTQQTLGEDTDILTRALLSCQTCAPMDRGVAQKRRLSFSSAKCLMRLCIGSQSTPCHLLLILSPMSTDFLGLYLLCIREISSSNPDHQEEKSYCLFFCSRIEMKVLLSCCMKQEEQGDDLQSHPPAPRKP